MVGRYVENNLMMAGGKDIPCKQALLGFSGVRGWGREEVRVRSLLFRPAARALRESLLAGKESYKLKCEVNNFKVEKEKIIRYFFKRLQAVSIFLQI